MFEKLIETLVALVAAMNNLADAYRGAAPAKPANETPAGEAPAEKKPRKSKTEQAPAAESSPAATAPAASTPVCSSTQAPAVAHPDVKEVVAAAQAFLAEVENQDGGLCARMAKQYNVERISLVAPEKRAEVIATFKAELEKAKAAKSQPAI